MWTEQHPDRNNPSAPLWWNFDTNKINTATMMSYQAITKPLKEIAIKADANKRINANLFRYIRATYMANHSTEAQMNVYFGKPTGGKLSSPMESKMEVMIKAYVDWKLEMLK
ncbi:MAG: hypothetical protein K8R11_00605 [Methanococcoides sp.]|nr:hypothetical protein [Methanococcoides sp.]